MEVRLNVVSLAAMLGSMPVEIRQCFSASSPGFRLGFQPCFPPTFVHGFSYGLCLDICSNSGMVGAD